MRTTSSIVNNLFWSFLIDSLVVVVAGLTIFIFPEILGLIVGISFIIIGVKGMIFAFKFRNNLSINI